jgi:hypothetical protein
VEDRKGSVAEGTGGIFSTPPLPPTDPPSRRELSSVVFAFFSRDIKVMGLAKLAGTLEGIQLSFPGGLGSPQRDHLWIFASDPYQWTPL